MKAKKIKFYQTAKSIKPFVFAGVFAVVGITALVFTKAAPPPITTDTSLPKPANVKAFGDDRVITVTWDGVNNSRVVGYYITYRKKGTSDAFKVKQVQAYIGAYGEIQGGVQLQPVENNVEYEINVQSAAGTWQTFANGSLDNHGVSGRRSSFAVADGKVSAVTTVNSTPSSARVDSMRSRLTGFFDDFNIPAGPFDESKWNQASTACVEPGTAGAFINDQFHSHNMLRSDCDRAGLVTRPRANFDISNATESSPASIEFDLDGTTQPRDTWYLDIIPLSARTNRLPLDVTTHNDLFDSDTEGPGNMVRINAKYDNINIAYYNANQNASSLGTVTYDGINMANKVAGLSPLPEPSIKAIPKPNLRRHWVVQITPTKLRIYIDSALVKEVNLPAGFTNEKVYTLHSTIFSYNTGKQYVGPNEGQSPAVGVPKFGVYPSVDMIHWDNFGFTGPAPTEKVYNYVEGGSSGNNPIYSTGNGTYNIPSGNRTTIIKIPDTIGSLVNNKARLFFTVQQSGLNYYYWASGDHVLVNGKRYDVPAPASQMAKGRSPISEPYVATAMSLLIDKADLKQGNNTIQFNLNGTNESAGTEADTLNVHLELPYAKNDSSAPAYTQPATVYGDPFLAIIRPAMSSCDQYGFVEQDLGLPYEAGKANMAAATCYMLPPASHTHGGGGGGTTPPPPPPPADTTDPTVSLTAPTSNQSVTGAFTLAASASDSGGTVSSVSFYLDGSTSALATDTVFPYTYNWATASVANGSHSLVAKAIDSSGNVGTSSTVTFTVSNTVADTTAPTTSITSPAAGASVANSTNVLASASDAVGVTKVELYVDGSLAATDTSSPYSFAWNTVTYPNGSHTLRTRAYDAANNNSYSTTLTVTVSNPVTPPSTPKAGDVNNDGSVNITDISILANNYGLSGRTRGQGDLNGDGAVNVVDLSIVSANIGK